MKRIIKFFDRAEDHVRAGLSHHPFVYSFLGGASIVLFWRGVWHSADYLEQNTYFGSILFSNLGSILVGAISLLMTGLFVSVFIGDSIIISGIRGDKKLIEKTESELESEISREEKILHHIQDDMHKIIDHDKQ